VTPEDVRVLARGRESQTVELKSDISDPPGNRELEGIAKSLVAFTNSDGGRVLFGVGNDGTIVGVRDKEHIENTVSSIVRDAIDPPITPSWEWVSVDDHDVLVVEAKKFGPLDFPRRHKDSRTYFIRVGRQSREATHHELRELFIKSTGYTLEFSPEGGTRFG
jgi:predicted HTH transcriptional regulator